MSDPGAPVAFELTHRPPSQRMAGLITGMTGYRETARGRFCQREAAPLAVPLIISFGTPFRIALGRDPDAADRQHSFAAGLHAGAVYIESDGAAECVQVDFTPLGAFRFFGGAVVDLAARMVDIGDVLGSEASRLRERLGATIGWQRRFDLLEDFVLQRADHLPSAEIAFAWRRLAPTGGGVRIAALAGEIGWSRKHLVDRFRSELGIAPKFARPHDALPPGLPVGENRRRGDGPGSRPRAVTRTRPISSANSLLWPASYRPPGRGVWR